MSMYGKNHYNIVISLQLIKINGKKKNKARKGRDWNVKCTGGFPSQYVNFIHSEVSAGQQRNEKKNYVVFYLV